MLKPRCTGNVLDRRHGPLPLLAAPSASRLLTAQFDELLEPSLRLSPLLQITSSDSSPKPLVQVAERCLYLSQFEVRKPTPRK